MKKLNWKSTLLTLLAVFSLFLLGACGQAPKKAYYQAISQEKKTDIHLTLEFKGDKMMSNKSESTIYYKEAGITKEQFEKIVSQYKELYKGMKGITYSVDMKDDYAVETSTTDYTKADLDELIKNKIVTAPANQKVSYISYKETTKLLKENGFKEVKDGKFEELK
ncbi:hypothetical protein BTU63_00670 [Streptococcus rubneri]|jgi:probable lipoprotein|uniref:DUF1307 domain-containing protein n=1 Tax=Streptococcus rubneri TaxID=1234680 RepID=A0A4Z1DXU7_9STRE|nr:DUF1307 domain-containing protein [Streptococcus rubneri]MBK4773441.1 hypothetical protein [Streptococcus rubneri]TGN92846.1 DUF1307 domain-containing protein [Streptococcus rubneri]